MDFKTIVSKALEIDAKHYLTQPKKEELQQFFSANSSQYELLLSAWSAVLMFGSVSIYEPDGQDSVPTQSLTTLSEREIESIFTLNVRLQGLFFTISEAARVAKNLVEEATGPMDLTPLRGTIFSSLCRCDSVIDAVGRIVFPVRFAVDNSSVLSKQAREKFEEIETLVKEYEQQLKSRFYAPYTYGQACQMTGVATRVFWMFNHEHVHAGKLVVFDNITRIVVQQLLGEVPNLQDICHMHSRQIFDLLSNGACNDTADKKARKTTRSPGSRLLNLMRKYPIFGYIIDGSGSSGLDSLYINEPNTKLNYCEYSTVPKNYKSYRSIGINNSVTTAEMKFTANRIIERAGTLSHARNKSVDLGGYNLTNKCLQHLFTILGDIRNDYNREKLKDDRTATIDCSSASDLMSYFLFTDLAGPEWKAHIDSIRNQYIMFGSQKRKLWKLTTMGDGWCFLFETLYFIAIAITAVYVYCIYNSKSQRQFESYVLSLWQHGDDTVIDQDIADTYMDFLELHGFIVNHDKSYTTGNYFESCGFEKLYGTLFQTVKWPRRKLEPEPTQKWLEKQSYIDMVTLQHKLYYNALIGKELATIIVEHFKFATIDPECEADNDVWLDIQIESVPSSRYQFDGYPSSVVSTSYTIPWDVKVKYPGYLKEAERLLYNMSLLGLNRTPILGDEIPYSKSDGSSVPVDRDHTRFSLFGAPNANLNRILREKQKE